MAGASRNLERQAAHFHGCSSRKNREQQKIIHSAHDLIAKPLRLWRIMR
jgi:hypothetical protein